MKTTKAVILLLFLGLLALDAAHGMEIPCTEQALHERIAELNANCSGDKAITFACPPGTAIPLEENIGDRSRDENCGIPGGDWYKGVAGCSSCPPAYAPGAQRPCAIPSYTFMDRRTITCSGVTIDGGNKVTFVLAPGCHDRLTKEDGKTEYEGGDFLFRIDAANVTIRNLAYRYFWEGIQIWKEASYAVIDRVIGERGCDDLLSSERPGSGAALKGGHVIRNSTFRKGTDKCVQLRAPDPSYVTDPAAPNFYFTQLIDNLFESCNTPLGYDQVGRHLADGNSFLNLLPGGNYACKGVWFGAPSDHKGPTVYFQNNVLDDCKEMLVIETTPGGNDVPAQAIVSGNTFVNGDLRGVAVAGIARALFAGNLFLDNGGTAGGNLKYGGLHVSGDAQVDAGGGSILIDGQLRSSAGLNSFLGNRCPADSTCDLVNEMPGPVKAEHNWWGQDANPGGKVSGAVDYVPWLAAPPWQACVDADGDGYGASCSAGPDCDDLDPSVHPGAEELTDFKDNNCDGQVDELNRAPNILTYHATPTLGPAPLPVAFFCGANDPDGHSWTATIDYGNGVTTGSCQLTTNVYAQPGLYHATLTLVDQFGAVAKTKIQIKVTEPGHAGEEPQDPDLTTNLPEP